MTTNNFFSKLFSPKKTGTANLKSVVITGSSGLVGTALVSALQGRYKVNCVSTKEGKFDVTAFEGAEAVIHLSGENIASGDGPLAILGRWSPKKKLAILNSRVAGTQLVVETISKLKGQKPKVLICASAVGYYGY